MSDIGKRAAEAVRQKAHEYEVTYTFEMECLGISREYLREWERRGYCPNAETLRRMVFAGYDIVYILTGEKNPERSKAVKDKNLPSASINGGEGMTIGQRAVQAVEQRAKETGLSKKQVCKNMGTSWDAVRYWKREKSNPGCYMLQRMYYAGYDIMWILLGDEYGK
jgi:DNA-binding transcriptional regulator YiaG